MRKGSKSAAQTKAPLKDRIKGSKVNIKGSASSTAKASSIMLSDEIISALSKKAQDFNEKNKGENVSVNTLKAVFRRGAGAFSTSHRPNMTRNGWAFARVNKFLDKKAGEKVKEAYIQDDDLMEKGGLIAPNGQKSNLTEEQYNLVRTPQFKVWFGDWENDPENASKVVDENGEPLVVYHGTYAKEKFNIFDFSKADLGFHFGTYEQAKDRSFTKFAVKQHKQFIEPFFLNIRELFLIEDAIEFEHPQSYIGDLVEKRILTKGEVSENSLNGLETKQSNAIIRDLLFEKYKKVGFKYDNKLEGEGYSYIVCEPNQIKLADGTNTTFDSNNPDIRFEKGGELKTISNQIGELAAPFQKELAEQRINRLIQEGEKVSKWEKELIYLGLVYDLQSAIGNYLLDTDKLIGEIKFEEGRGGSIEISAKVQRDGEEYNFRTEMIIAGGYNIQRRHYRYIVHTGLKYHQGNAEAESVQKEIKDLKEKIKFENKIEEYKKDIEFYKNTIEKYKAEIAHNKQFTDEQIWEMLKEQKDYRAESYSLTWEEMVRREAPVVEMTKSKEGYEAYKYENYYLDGIKSWKESNISHLEGRTRSYTGEIKKIEKRIQKSQGLEQGGELEDLHQKMKDDLLQDSFKTHKSIEQIAEEKGVELDYAQEQLRKGMQTESEHSNDPMVQEIIALQHLDEMIDYYEKLAYMEAEILKEGGELSKKWYRKYNDNYPFSYNKEARTKYGSGIYFSSQPNSRFEGEKEIEVIVEYKNPKIYENTKTIPNRNFIKDWRQNYGEKEMNEFVDGLFSNGYDSIIVKHGDNFGDELIIRDESLIKNDNMIN